MTNCWDSSIESFTKTGAVPLACPLKITVPRAASVNICQLLQASTALLLRTPPEGPEGPKLVGKLKRGWNLDEPRGWKLGSSADDPTILQVVEILRHYGQNPVFWYLEPIDPCSGFISWGASAAGSQNPMTRILRLAGVDCSPWPQV